MIVAHAAFFVHWPAWLTPAAAVTVLTGAFAMFKWLREFPIKKIVRRLERLQYEAGPAQFFPIKQPQRETTEMRWAFEEAWRRFDKARTAELLKDEPSRWH